METNVQFLLEQLLVAIGFLYTYSYIWLTIVLGILFFEQWVNYLHTKVSYEAGSVLLEIKLPKEIRKSPLAMELVLTAMWQKGTMNFLETYWKGKVVPNFSLELVSIGGQVHFFIWTAPKFKNIIEAQLYAQYPSVEIFQVEDYSLSVQHDLSKMVMWGTYFKLKKADPFPIKTYIDYELDKNAKEEHQETVTDPISATIEFLGSIKPGEQVWIQILIRAHRSYGIDAGKLVKKPDWIKDIDKEIQNVLDKYKPEKPKPGEPVLPPPPFTEEDKVLLKAFNRSKAKYSFDTAIRGIYMAKKENADFNNIPGLIGSFRQYDDNTLNQFSLGFFTDFDYPWQDFRRMRRTAREKGILDAYKRRSFFYGMYQFWAEKPFILTTEELATIFHLPGGVVSTPTLDRISSRKSEAPPNLPI